MSHWLLLPGLVALSFALTAGLRRYALSRSLLDLPNARSSHSAPTPRGGGVAIVVSFLIALFMQALAGEVSWTLSWALLWGGAGIAVLGFLDDHRPVAARWRLLGHFAAAAWALACLGGLPVLSVFGWRLDLGWFGHLLALVYLVWVVNLYNFMDGIDGIASVEAISVCAGAALIYALLGEWQVVSIPVMLALAVTGFMVWNFPVARIFMGDAGSGFLGFSLGVLSLDAAWSAPHLLWSWVILLGVFVVDATFTLLRRLLRGERIYLGHRTHAYQYAARHFGRHWPVTAGVAAINLLWLLPIALWVGWGGLDGGWGVLLAYAPLLALAVKFEAGAAEQAPGDERDPTLGRMREAR